MTHDAGFETLAIHAGQEPDPTTGAVVPPIYQVSTYAQDGVGGLRNGYEYSRSGNPTRTALQECLAALEDPAGAAAGTTRAMAFASGLAAEDTLLRTVLEPGSHAVIPDDAYGGTFRLFDKVLERWGVDHSPARLTDLDSVAAAVERGRTKVVWVETPTNPLLRVADIAAIAEVAHAAGALLVVDNTFASPYLQQPLLLGADVVVHSTTKYLGGHSDVVGGALVASDPELAERLAYHQNAMGAVAGPFDAWLTLRGIKTLGVRMDRHCANAKAVTHMLREHPRVVEVFYPGLETNTGTTWPPSRCATSAAWCAPCRRRRAGRARRLRPHQGLHPGRVARRGRVAHRAPGTHDPRLGGRFSARGAGRPRPAQRGHRDGRRPGRRHGAGTGVTPEYVVCVDTGSTFTKAAAVSVGGTEAGRLLATAAVPTTVGPGLDVLSGLDDAVGEVVSQAGGEPADVRVCSSAGGGLRLAVVGYERVVTAEAGARVGLSAGAKVVHVSSGPLDSAGVRELRSARPDVVLLVGGTDGGDSDVLRHNASRLASSGPSVPYVVAGNVDVRGEVVSAFERRHRTVVACANVLPRIGVLDPHPARAAIRDVFVRHVIGGKGLTRGPRFARMVRGATPDLVLAGVELLADSRVGDVLLVDVGGATTDVYSALTPDAEEASLHRDVVETMWRGRTVEGDLGLRWGATGVAEAALAEKLVAPGPGASTRSRRPPTCATTTRPGCL